MFHIMRISIIIGAKGKTMSSATGEMEQRVRARLEASAYRYTAGRARVVRLIEATRGPRSASDLHASMRDGVPLSSLYRTLTILSESGVVVRTHGADGVALYEPAEWLRGHHHHLVCVDCGTVEDVAVDSGDESLLAALADRVAASQGYAARGHRIDVEGICRRCAA